MPRRAMRQKAEKQIREAVTRMGGGGPHFLPRVREGSGLHPKVFDKTILDMERVGTIALFAGNLNDMAPEAIAGCVRHGSMVYTSFRFIDGTPDAPGAAAADAPEVVAHDSVVVVLEELLPQEWALFEALCRKAGDRSPSLHVTGMIRDFIRRNL